MINNKRVSVGAALAHLDADRTVPTHPDDNTRRRTLRLTKKEHSWGFTLQTYGIRHKKTNEIEMMTYVDYVDLGGSAWMAGMRRGDVILSVNGERVGELSHMQLVQKIQRSGNTIRMVVLFEDCCRKVELHDRFIKLKMVLKEKYKQLKDLELKEMEIFDNYCVAKGLNRFEHLRQSVLSMASSGSDSSWDAYSAVSSPKYRKPGGDFPSVTSLNSFSMGDNSSNLDVSYEDSLCYIDSDTDSDSIIVDIPGITEVTPKTVATKQKINALFCANISSDSDSTSDELKNKSDENIKCENCDTVCENCCYGAGFIRRGKSGTLIGDHDREFERREKSDTLVGHLDHDHGIYSSGKSNTITEKDQNELNGMNGSNKWEYVKDCGQDKNSNSHFSSVYSHICDHNANTHKTGSEKPGEVEFNLAIDNFGGSTKSQEDNIEVPENMNSRHKGNVPKQAQMGVLCGAMGNEITFHVGAQEVVYINERDEVTNL